MSEMSAVDVLVVCFPPRLCSKVVGFTVIY